MIYFARDNGFIPPEEPDPIYSYWEDVERDGDSVIGRCHRCGAVNGGKELPCYCWECGSEMTDEQE